MADKIQPALSAEEWANYKGAGVTRGDSNIHVSDDRILVAQGELYHRNYADLPPDIQPALIALANRIGRYFTWEMVDALRAGANAVHSEFQTTNNPEPYPSSELEAIADLFESLLPPRA